MAQAKKVNRLNRKQRMVDAAIAEGFDDVVVFDPSPRGLIVLKRDGGHYGTESFKSVWGGVFFPKTSLETKERVHTKA